MPDAGGAPTRERTAKGRGARLGVGRLELFAGCAPGLEPHLLAEIEGLGLVAAGHARVVPGGVRLAGDHAALYRANLELGLALEVLVRVARFPAPDFATLVRRAREVPWEEWLVAGGTVDVRVASARSRLYHGGAVQERIRRAIGERVGHEPEAPGKGEAPALGIRVRLRHDRATLSLDASGEPLHRRGWRLAGGKAPLREDLARALVVLCGWDRHQSLFDPFAGSGTIAIEAALLARRIPPGRARRFAFERWPGFDGALWARVRAAAEERIDTAATPAIVASDRDAGAIRAARENAARAGVADLIELEVAALAASRLATRSSASPIVVATNPPFGRRVSAGRDLRPLYQSLGHHLRALPAGSKVALVALDPRLARMIGLPLRTALLTEHGGCKVRFLLGATVLDVSIDAADR